MAKGLQFASTAECKQNLRIKFREKNRAWKFIVERVNLLLKMLASKNTHRLKLTDVK